MNKKYYKYLWLLLIPFFPIALNTFLPMGSFSNIGNKNDSLQIWLDFWATYSNSVLFCLITLFVLYKQIDSNKSENEKTRLANEKQNEDNRIANEKQNIENRKLTLNTLTYSKRMKDLSAIIPVCSEYITLFDIDEIKLLKRRWQKLEITGKVIQNHIKDRIEHGKKIWYSLSLILSSQDEDCQLFLSNQKCHIDELEKLYMILIQFFNLNPSEYNTPEGKERIRLSLKESSLLYPFFKEQNNPFFDIEYEFSDIGLNNIYLETQYFITRYKTNSDNILNG